MGEFVVTEPMPSMPVQLWNDPDGARYRGRLLRALPRRRGARATGSRSAPEGEVTVSGRSDATLNRGGVRLGSAEIYGAVERLPEIADSLVVGVELPDGGYYMPLFVVPAQDGADGLATARGGGDPRRTCRRATSLTRSSWRPPSRGR